MIFLAFLTIAIALTSAAQWEAAAATSFLPTPGWNPKPTSSPEAQLVANDLRRRQHSSYSYDNTCGYISGAIRNSVTCGDTFLTCSPDHSNFALACCGGSTDACYAVTQCINSYESLALCRSTSGCVSQVYTLTCSESTAPFCRRWTGGGYSAYGCGTFPAVESISIPFLAVTSGSVAITTTETVTVTVAPSASVSSCAKSVPAGAIAGGVIGGLVVLAAAAVGLMYLLRHKGPTSPPPVPVMAEQAPNSPYPSQAPSSPYRTSHTSGAPLYTGFQEAPAQGRGEWVQ